MTEADRASDPVGPDLQEAAAPIAGRVLALAASTVVLPGFVHVSEREAGPWICCAPSSAAMVAGYAGLAPATLATGHDIRTAAGLAHVGGLRPSEVKIGSSRAVGLDLVDIARTRDAIDAKLRAGWAVIVPHTYGLLPTDLRRWSPRFTGGHSAVLAGTTATAWGWHDPLAPQGYAGEYVSPTAIIRAAWSGGIMGAPGARGDQMIELPAPLRTAATLLVKQGTIVYSDAGATDRITVVSRDGAVPYVGTSGVCHALVVRTGAGAATPRDVVAYVKRADVVAKPVPTPPDTDDDARAMWDKWAAGFGIPPRP